MLPGKINHECNDGSLTFDKRQLIINDIISEAQGQLACDGEYNFQSDSIHI